MTTGLAVGMTGAAVTTGLALGRVTTVGMTGAAVTTGLATDTASHKEPMTKAVTVLDPKLFADTIAAALSLL